MSAEPSDRQAERKPAISVFVPALNEERHVEIVANGVVRAATQALSDYEIILVDDGSTDRTPEIMDRLARENPRIRVIHHPQRKGLGTAYRSAVAVATKGYFVFIPGDDAWPYESVLGLFRHFGTADVLTCYAVNPEARRGGLVRQFISAGYTVLLNVLYGLDLRYYNGLTIYPTEYLRASPVRTSGFGFAAELLLHAIYGGMTYAEVGLRLEELEKGVSKAVTLKNILSVTKTAARCFWTLRVRRIYSARSRGHRIGPRASDFGS